MHPPRGHGSGDGAGGGQAGPVPGRWGESLRFAADDGDGGRDGGATVAHCAHCDATLGDAAGDWRDLAATVEVSAEDLGPLVQLPPELVARQYVCPSCVTALWVEVVPADTPAWRDFTLH
jgi:N-methylhydantoinase B